MSDVRAAYDPNRLPWLNDTDGGRSRGRSSVRRSSPWAPVVLFGLLALMLVAGVAYWAGMRSVARVETAAVEEPLGSQATAILPQPREEPAAPQVQPAPARDLQPVAPPAMLPVDRPQQPAHPATDAREAGDTVAALAQETGSTDQESGEAAAPAADDSTLAAAAATPQVQPPELARPAPLTLWPADVSQGAAGRIVRIGTFPSRIAAKRAWSRIVKVYPGMKRLNATVVSAPSARNARTYYRLQFGTTSQAHSAVLCQRMRIVGQSCVVVGTPAA